ncbi:hypothetical protein HJC23_000064 [Cyclotella cryptica]|uniref:SET domain-containing protein n=1 Tax=Cyclotella cryptica TaxID=29204 RepID=A0ABD3PJQ8_9STRA|eukprot:CCRYP_014372-RA/>CCRYP_014372-RA protein AED:0.00 eAED:0.00 QI:284/-1/1/1/-1/1/1/306/556
MTSDDPFACFGNGDDSDDTDDDMVHTTSDGRAFARQLVEKTNSIMRMDKSVEGQRLKACTDVTFQSSYQDQQERVLHLPWPNRPPLYLGPIHLNKSLTEGGGRGYVASQDLPPGTCVLIEEPLVDGWSEEQMGRRLGLESIKHMLHVENAKTVVECLRELHPRKEKVDEVFRQIENGGQSSDPLDVIQIVEMMSSLEKDVSFRSELQSLVAYAEERKICNPDGSSLSSRDINRMLLALRYNGFESGLYLHFSMFNHHEDPNCIKFRPSNESPQSTQHYNYSEARTTRFVKKGEPLTLHYLENPREVSHATRRRVLWDQHRFDIGGEDMFLPYLNSPRKIYESELVGGKFPPSSRDDSTKNDDDPPTTVNIEKSLDDLEDMLLELQAAFKSKIGNDDISSYFERAAALELTVGELITASQSALNNNHHILLSRCKRLHLDVVELLLSNCSQILTNKQSIELMVRFLQSVQPLLESQRRRCGNDHPDVARTYHDFSMGIQSMLSHAPKRLMALNFDGMVTLEQCSKMEHFCRSEKERIERLYPKDVPDIIARVSKESV